ncbi:radical SAM protein [Treponema ruminis]|uniref:DNA repair photolyase n=1 Tax=Treponema ruminis TaxID=744515 RepID=A0A7W8LN81_9SPIR|nr:radical SAM protein [Treponema ruminis]MBB5227237.1 DNA repair photolyase [Treponema ruminis]QSI01534.1 radical SAM protein [Treponema ruminis]
MHFVNAKTILNRHGINIYRGCSHGCIYCDSRSKCYQFTHEFEDIEVKQNAPELLEEALRKKRRPCMIGTGSMCDPYIPQEKELRLTRRCLEVIDKYNFGAAVLTKSDLVLRDLDLLSRINRKSKAVVQMTLTTADDSLCKKIEPGVCPTSRRFETLCACRDEGIPTVVWFTPLLPFINDTKENIDGIIDYCVRAKVHAIICFGIGLTLREGNREYFYSALDRLALQHSQFANLKERYIRTFGNSYMISSPRNNELMTYLSNLCRKNKIMLGVENVFRWMEEFPEPASAQLEFDF